MQNYKTTHCIIMSDSPLDGFSTINRVSIRAVLVKPGEDPSAALAEAGFAETVSIPVILGEDGSLANGILGDGITANLIGILETDHEQAWQQDATPNDTARMAQPHGRDGGTATTGARTTGTGTKMLPEAFGQQPLAPVRGPSA